MVQPATRAIRTLLSLKIQSISALAIFVLGHLAHADIMFEGYYKIANGSSKIGFFIQRYEFDPKTKQFRSIYFIQTNQLGGNTTESLTALADNKFQPISYQYTVKTPQMTKTIDAKFKANILDAVVSESGKSPQVLKKKVPKGTFLSTFLGYLMLQTGYSVGKKFKYSAIAEEDAESYDGNALIKDQQEFLKQKVFRVINTFKGVEFISYVTDKGEVLGTQSPLQKVSTELGDKVNEVTNGFTLPVATLKILFGKVPVGTQNILALRPSATPLAKSKIDKEGPSKKMLPNNKQKEIDEEKTQSTSPKPKESK